MTPTDTIETTLADLARTIDFTAVKAAERLPSPLDGVVLRVGAVNAEAVRQFGLVTATNIHAVRGLATVTWTGVSELAETTGDAIERSAGTVRTTARRVGGRIGQEAEGAAERSVRAADTGAAETYRSGASHPSGPYESWSKDELYERAQELDIDGRSQMSKQQLVRALRAS